MLHERVPKMRRAVFGNILTEAVTLLSRRDSSVRRELVRRRILQRKKKTRGRAVTLGYRPLRARGGEWSLWSRATPVWLTFPQCTLLRRQDLVKFVNGGHHLAHSFSLSSSSFSLFQLSVPPGPKHHFRVGQC